VGCRDVKGAMTRFLSCLLWRCLLLLRRIFGFNHKIMVKVYKSPPNIMITRNLWSTRVWVRDWLCKEKMYHSQCTLPKVSCIAISLFFSRSGFYYWSCLRFKVDLSSQKSLYLIRLNPNHSTVWVSALHLFYVLYL